MLFIVQWGMPVYLRSDTSSVSVYIIVVVRLNLNIRISNLDEVRRQVNTKFSLRKSLIFLPPNLT